MLFKKKQIHRLTFYAICLIGANFTECLNFHLTSNLYHKPPNNLLNAKRTTFPGITNFSNNRNGRLSTSLSMSKIEFKGRSAAEISFISPVSSSIDSDDPEGSRSFNDFLKHPESNMVLLGGNSKNCIPRSSNHQYDIWEVKQQPIAWFGANLVSTFVNKIDRSLFQQQKKILVSVIDAKTNIVDSGGRERRRNDLIVKLMNKSSFTGGTSFIFLKQPSRGNDCWLVKADLSLTLKVDLPPFLPLPPGFNQIGSTIVNNTCEKRISQNLKDLEMEYKKWALRPVCEKVN